MTVYKCTCINKNKECLCKNVMFQIFKENIEEVIENRREEKSVIKLIVFDIGFSWCWK